MTAEEQVSAVSAIGSCCTDLHAWSETYSKRTPLVVAIRKLLLAADRACRITELSAPKDLPIEIVALAARNMFEILLRLLHVCLAPANLERWSSEAIGGRIDLYEGLLQGADDTSQTALVIRAEIDHQKRFAAERGLSDLATQPLATRNIAKSVDMDEEYVALYRMYSKLVHPSSYAVNYPREDVDSAFHRDAMFMKLQEYGLRMIEAARVELGAPPTVVAQIPPN